MNTLQKTFIGIIGVYIAIVGAFLIHTSTQLEKIAQSPTPVVGSTPIGAEYQSTTTTSSLASNSTTTPVFTHTGTLGSIVIASSSATAFGIYDSAVGSTTAYSGAGTATSTKIATFPANAAAGTYTFDINVTRGLILDVPSGFNGIYTVTFRR